MNESKATRYRRLRRRADVVAWCSAGLMLAILAGTPAARWLSLAALRFGDGLSPWLHTAVALFVFVGFVLLLWEAAALPAVLFLALRVDGAYGRSEATIEDALMAQARATALALPAAWFMSAVVLLSVQVAGPWWWTLAGLAVSGGLIGVLHGGPTLLAALARVMPLSRPALAGRLRQLALDVRVPVAGIDEWAVGEAATTAVVTGVGARRRILVSSEVVRTWTDDEIAVVVAHELAHHAHHDLWRALALDAVILCGALCAADVVLARMGPLMGVAGPADFAALPVLALTASLVWTLLTPVRHAQSRRHERHADLFALRSTGQAEAFAAAVRRLSARHLADERPSRLTRWLFHRHPPVRERLALADAFQRREHGGTGM
jgi:STE24 endopeptidase